MVTQMGFSELLGDVDLDSNEYRLSGDTKQKIENEVRRIIDESRQRAQKILTERRKELDLLANALVEYEVLNLEEIQKVLKGEKLAKLGSTPKSPIKLPELELPPSLGAPSGPGVGAGGEASSPTVSAERNSDGDQPPTAGVLG